MSEKERQLAIITEVKKNIGVTVSEMAQKFNVTPNTIRRDFKILEKEGIIKKIHGAAILNDFKKYDVPFEKREIEYSKEKNTIGKKAVSFVNNGETIIIGAGTTCLAMATHIKTKKEVTVLTNSIAIANELIKESNIVVILSGGILKKSTKSLIGPPAEDFFKIMQVDKLFISTGGISVIKNKLFNPNMHEKPVRKQMIEVSDKTYLLADSHKFNYPALYPFCNLDEMDKVITDNNIDKNTKKEVEKLGTQVIIAN